MRPRMENTDGGSECGKSGKVIISFASLRPVGIA